MTVQRFVEDALHEPHHAVQMPEIGVVRDIGGSTSEYRSVEVIEESCRVPEVEGIETLREPVTTTGAKSG